VITQIFAGDHRLAFTAEGSDVQGSARFRMIGRDSRCPGLRTHRPSGCHENAGSRARGVARACRRLTYLYQLCSHGTPRALAVADLCPAKAARAHCLAGVVATVNDALKAGRFVDPEQDVEINPTSDDLNRFTITKKGLRFFLDETLSADSRTAVFVDISFRTLARVLDRKGPVGPLLGAL
jgi:hypothetical protein